MDRAAYRLREAEKRAIRDEVRARLCGSARRRRRHLPNLHQRRNELLLLAWKRRPCEDCGVRFPDCAMTADHRGDKAFTIASGWRKETTERLAEELAKCDLVCANCHAVRTKLRYAIRRAA